MYAKNLVLLAAELVLYFGVLAGLFRVRRRLGIGPFVTALGTMHFLETYLAASLYVPLGAGLVVSPGSSVLFAGKLIMLLLVYIKEDAATTRQPVYGLLVGNFLIVGLVVLMRLHDLAPASPDQAPDLRFLDEMGWLMVWGTLLLYVDAIAVVLIYEKLGRWLRHAPAARIWLSASLVLTFDQFGFFAALRLLLGVPYEALFSGWVGKIASSLAFAILAGLYLRWGEREPERGAGKARLRDLFDTLTYRERYHALLEESGRDALTGALGRNRLETHGRQAADLALASGQAVAVFVADIDRFKTINDRFGHGVGDEVLKGLAAALGQRLRATDYLFRYGGDEFVACCPGMPPDKARVLAESLMAELRFTLIPGTGATYGVSVGVATGPADGRDFDALFRCADERLYARKRLGQGLARSLGDVFVSVSPSRARGRGVLVGDAQPESGMRPSSG